MAGVAGAAAGGARSAGGSGAGDNGVAAGGGAGARALRLVLDTNVWLDWLVFDDPGIAPIAAAVAAGSAEVVIDDAAEAELARVLGYPFKERALAAGRQAECLARCRNHRTSMSSPTARSPIGHTASAARAFR